MTSEGGGGASGGGNEQGGDLSSERPPRPSSAITHLSRDALPHILRELEIEIELALQQRTAEQLPKKGKVAQLATRLRVHCVRAPMVAVARLAVGRQDEERCLDTRRMVLQLGAHVGDRFAERTAIIIRGFAQELHLECAVPPAELLDVKVAQLRVRLNPERLVLGRVCVFARRLGFEAIQSDDVAVLDDPFVPRTLGQGVLPHLMREAIQGQSEGQSEALGWHPVGTRMALGSHQPSYVSRCLLTFRFVSARIKARSAHTRAPRVCGHLVRPVKQ